MSAISPMRNRAAAAASLLGRGIKAEASGSNDCVFSRMASQFNSIGNKCCTGLSNVPFSVFRRTARMIPSFPGYVSVTMAKGHFPRILLSD